MHHTVINREAAIAKARVDAAAKRVADATGVAAPNPAPAKDKPVADMRNLQALAEFLEALADTLGALAADADADASKAEADAANSRNSRVKKG